MFGCPHHPVNFYSHFPGQQGNSQLDDLARSFWDIRGNAKITFFISGTLFHILVRYPPEDDE